MNKLNFRTLGTNFDGDINKIMYLSISNIFIWNNTEVFSKTCRYSCTDFELILDDLNSRVSWFGWIG